MPLSSTRPGGSAKLSVTPRRSNGARRRRDGAVAEAALGEAAPRRLEVEAIGGGDRRDDRVACLHVRGPDRGELEPADHVPQHPPLGLSWSCLATRFTNTSQSAAHQTSPALWTWLFGCPLRACRAAAPAGQRLLSSAMCRNVSGMRSMSGRSGVAADAVVVVVVEAPAGSATRPAAHAERAAAGSRPLRATSSPARRGRPSPRPWRSLLVVEPALAVADQPLATGSARARG